ncbi:MAG: hypothetical protein AAF458_07670 [Pseudomonadota bacterium]
MSLVARYLEEHGIPTVVVGSARDIVEHCGVPRFLFSDIPLGNPCGRPWQRDEQLEVVAEALDMLAEAPAPGLTWLSAAVWPHDPAWRTRYGRVGPDNAAALAATGDERRLNRAALRQQDASGNASAEAGA